MLNLFLLLLIFISFLSHTLMIFVWKKHIYFNSYSNIQNINNFNVPRISGFISYPILCICLYYSGNHFYDSLIYFSIIFPIIAIEDFFQNIRPIIRLITLFFAATAYFCIEVNNITIPLNENSHFLLYMLLICLMVLFVNACNIIDGLNGLLLGIFFIFLAKVLFTYDVSTNLEDFVLLSFFVFSISLIFNFPFPKVFLGDTGSYLIGFIISIIIVDIYINVKDVSLLELLFLVIYPLFEITFSILRRIFHKKSIFDADFKHLHSKVYTFLKKRLVSDNYANNLSTVIILSFVTIFNLISFVYSNYLLLILCFIFIYLMTYIFFEKNED
jgi:UDP-GlcNAc:undecaprenyl-phosphate GlcNAc-1-phosphate transferase